MCKNLSRYSFLKVVLTMPMSISLLSMNTKTIGINDQFTKAVIIRESPLDAYNHDELKIMSPIFHLSLSLNYFTEE